VRVANVDLSTAQRVNVVVPLTNENIVVTRPDGTPVNGATVTLTCGPTSFAVLGKTASGTQCGSETTNASGRSILTLLPASSVTLTVTPPAESGLARLTKTVSPSNGAEVRFVLGGVAITTTALPSTIVQKAYPSTTLQASGGTKPYSWTVAAGALPPGVKLSPAGVLSGTPTASGTFTLTARVTDAKAVTSTKDLSITVSPMTVTTTNLSRGKVARPYSAQFTCSGGKATFTWKLRSGSLPPGLRLSSAGKLTGTPSKAGTFSFVVVVTDGSKPANDASRTFTLVVDR
jgi:hypothetical protein